MKRLQKRLLYKVAHMYYDLDLKQSDIANKLGLERSTISKYLKRAKDEGIVRIEIKDTLCQRLEYQLEEKYHMKEVSIIPTYDNLIDQYVHLGQAGGDILCRFLKKNMVVGFNWGRSMSAISQYISQTKLNNISVDFVPLVGGCTHKNVQLHGNTICYSLAQSFNARCHSLYAPVITTSASLKQAIEEDISFQNIRTLWEKLDIAFVGIGAPKSSSNIIWNASLKQKDIITTNSMDMVGETCTRFYDEKGLEVDTSLSERTISIELDLLKKAQYVIGVAVGVEKKDAIKAAMLGGLINVLITDEKTAMELLEK